MTCAPYADLSRADVRGLRREAFRLLRSDSRRSAFPPTLRIGHLGAWPAEVHACEVPRVVDPPFALDVVGALLLDRRTADGPDVWLTRPGDPSPDHLDRVWARALDDVAQAHDLARPRLFVVTRTGWQRVGGDEGQRWKRLRLVLPS